MKVSDINALSSYDYELPQHLIATKPTMPKKHTRLLVYERESDKISHLTFEKLPEILPPCDIIFNDTKVVKARIFGTKDSGARVELMLNSPLTNDEFSVYIRGKVRVKSEIEFEAGLKAVVMQTLDDGSRIVKFSQNGVFIGTAKLFEILNQIGHIPLPPYIKREDSKDDESWYQSIFAKNEGAVAAPTASLHFDDEMIKELQKEHKISFITLHVGAGTFKAVESENINEHKMHGEFYNIPENTQDLINSDRPILGIGTTVTRCVEEFARSKKASSQCKLFLNLNNPPIRQNYLLTNFHLPKSTLIMLVSSFIGLEKTMQIYKIAVQNEYKFYSYGDAMLII